MDVNVFKKKYKNSIKIITSWNRAVCTNLFWHYLYPPILVDGTMDRIKYVTFLEVPAHSHRSIFFLGSVASDTIEMSVSV